MGTLPLVLYWRALRMLWLLVLFSFATSFTDVDRDDPSVFYTYNRFTEIQEKCGPVLSPASELEPDDNRGSRIRKELSFVNGDWDQESGAVPLMPFDDTEMQRNRACPGSFLKLASFWVVDVDPVRRVKDMVSISGIMEIGITENQFFNCRPCWSPKFRKDPGISSMTILFEGVYVESEKNGGERLICLLGTSMTTTTNQFVPPLELTDKCGYKFENQPPLVQDDQIMLVLRYSKTFSLTTGNISGELKSLHKKSNFKYFDRVHISSHFGCQSKYQFGDEELLSKACSPYPYQDSLVDEDIVLLKNNKYCDTLQHFLRRRKFDVVPSWKAVCSNDDGNKLGPFILGGKSKAIDEGCNNFRLLVQNLHCDQGTDENNIKTARVFALFRLIHPWQDGYTSADRTGLSGMTLFAEGMWRSPEGQLCMVGCLGIVGTTSERCNSRICLYFPLTFSINQRSVFFGTITSINDTESYSLWFGTKTHSDAEILSKDLWKMNLQWSYNYSKITQANAFKMRSKPSVTKTSVRKSSLVYPSLNDSGIPSLSLLADELSFRVFALPCDFANGQTQRIHVDFEVLSLGSLFRRNWLWRRSSYPVVEQASNINPEMIEISGYLSITGENFNNLSLSFEGMYDSTVGEMFLVGCRDVRIIQKNIKEEMNLEGGMDCLFEIKVEYLSRKAQWLKYPELRISINSKRREEDPLHLSSINLKTAPIPLYKHNQLSDNVFRKTYEEILRVLMLAMAIVCTRSQVHYLNNVVDPIAYISLTMIYVPAVDYISPLINGGEIFFKWKVFKPQSHLMYAFMAYERFRILDFIIKVLSLYALLLTFDLVKKVSKSRTRQVGSGHTQQSRFPTEKKVFFVTLAVHVIGFLVTQVIRVMMGVEMVPLPNKYLSRKIMLLQWIKELDGYLGLVPDFFLLPQIIANTLWQNKGKPVRKLYYLGLTSLRILLHVYDCIRDPIPDRSYDDYQYPYMTLVLYSKFGNIVIAVMVIVLAVIVFKQQKSNHRESALNVVAEEYNKAAVESEEHESLLS